MIRDGNAPGAQDTIEYARNTLKLALGADMERTLSEVASMLVEREPALSQDAALADIQGHLADLTEVLSEYAD